MTKTSIKKLNLRILFLSIAFVVGSLNVANASILRTMKLRILYSEPEVTVSFSTTRGLSIIVGEPTLVGWQDYCSLAWDSCDESKQMIVLADD